MRIIGTVVDAETGKPLERFLLIRGIGYDDGRAPWWMRHDFKTISNGRYETTIVQEGFSYLVRVEAEGYLPAVSRIFRPYNPDQGEVTYNFELKKANRLTGTVLGLDGMPLANANVYLETQRMKITDRKVTFSETAPVKTDAAGRFELPPEVEPFCVVVVHEQGVAMTTEKDFKSPPRITVRPWTGRNATLLIIRKPAPGQSVDFPVNDR